MLSVKAPVSLSRILAIRMTLVSICVSVLLTLILSAHYLSNVAELRQATLLANSLLIAKTLQAGKDPAALPLYRNYPDSYGFRVYNRRKLARRRILASANTRWLPPLQHPMATKAGSDADRDAEGAGSDLVEGFQQFRPSGMPEHQLVSLLVHRELLDGRKYWIQIYMVEDPAWAGLAIVESKLLSHVVIPVLFIVPALTLAMFLTTRRALQPLRQLSRDAVHMGTAVARGQLLTPVAHHSMVQEFADVAAAVNTTLANLERSLQLQKQFTSDAAHELRTPLSVLLLEVSRLPRDAARDRIKGDIEELGRLVNELLRFAQAEDVMVHELADVDVVAIARKVCEDAVPKAIARQQVIELENENAVQTVPGNSVLIEIAIRNLVDNALKYSGPGTTVTVKIENNGRIIVEDRGPGIAVEQHGAVFDRFWRADRRTANGSGIGLSLVRRIAQLHDGAVGLENRRDGGTRMTLCLNHSPSGQTRTTLRA